MKKINFMLTAFRDGFQSVFGARVFSKDFLPVVAAASEAGIRHFEAGGGALFQAAYFYSNEDAFQVMDQFREITGPEANLQTLARGVNVVGLDSQPRDIIKLHAQLMKKHGITTIRNFDALNDVQNLIYSGNCIAEAGLNHEVTVTMMELPPGCSGHTPEFYNQVLRRILDAGIPFHSVCFKDASGTSTPHKVHTVIANARKLLGDDVTIVFHTHETAGCGVSCYQAAIAAGVSQIDLSIAPVSGGTCQPDILTMWHALRGTEYTLDIDYHKVLKLEETFKNALKDYFMPPEATMVDPRIPFFPMPGGALTANTQMLRDNGLMDKYSEVIAAMGDAVARGGYGTSVTPVSQFYFQQAFNNVMFGPWKKIADGYGKMVLGYFGHTPEPPDPEIVKIAAEQLKLQPTTANVLDLNDANPGKGRKAAVALLETNKLPCTDENIFIAASCQEKGITFLKGEAKIGVRKNAPAAGAKPAAAQNDGPVRITINRHAYDIKLKDGMATVNGKEYPFSIGDAPAPVSTPASAATGDKLDNFVEVFAPLPGVVVKINTAPGENVAKDSCIIVVEAMKMETAVQCPTNGVTASLQVQVGDRIQAGQLLAVIKY